MTNPHLKPSRIAVVGAGSVGSTLAYTLVLSGMAGEIVLVDANQAKAEGEAMDLNHTVPFAKPARIWAGSYDDCAQADIIVVAAGVGQKPGETRLDLVKRNVEVFRQIIPAATRDNPGAILLIATNPVDVLTYAALQFSGLPQRQVIGSGTLLDTARFRALLGQHFGLDPRSIHAFIIGEHGDSEVPVWSLAHIAGMRLDEFCAQNGLHCEQPALDEIFRQTRDAAYEIIRRKGATYYAIGAGLMDIVEAVLRDHNTVLTVSSLIDGYYGIDDVCLSLPTIVDRGGAERFFRLELSPDEIEQLRRSADILKRTIAEAGI